MVFPPNKMSGSEFHSMCRLCVQIFDKEKVFPIFNNETYNDKISLPERIRYCSSIEVAENDGLPPEICNTCLLKLNESFVFRNQCVFADIILKHLKDFSFNVNEIPNLSKMDFESQIISSGNDDFLFKVYSSFDVLNKAGKRKENIDEFDNSKNGRHRRNIHKLKSLPLQKKNALNHETKEPIENLIKSKGLETNLCSSPNFINPEKLNKKESEKKNSGNSSSKKIRKLKKVKKIKQFLKTHKKLPQDSKKQKVTDIMNLNVKNRCESFQNASLNSDIEEITQDFDEGTVKSKSLNPKRGRRKKFSFTKEKPSSFKCDYCEKVYPSEGGWRYHIHTMHNENYQPFICDLCGQAFKVKKNLEAHKNSVHFHLKHHLCDLCGRGFASKYSLKVHKSWHNDEKNFSCDVCGTKFRTRGKMNTHRSIHGGPKKFMCHICSRDFRWKKDFEIHMRTHTGEKPFKCSHCGKAFASLTNMKKHEKNHLKKIETDKMSDKFDVMALANDGKSRRNEFLNFGYGSEDVRNHQTNQVSETTLYLVCK